MKKGIWSAVVLSAVLLAASSGSARAAFAYTIPAGTVGNSDYTGSIGMDFNVGATSVVVTRLGAFDSANITGFAANKIFVAVYDRTTQTIVGPTAEFTQLAGDPVGGYRYLDVPDFALPAGFQGSIVAWSYNSTEQSFDAGPGAVPAGWATDASGLISFVGTGRTGAANAFPDTPNASGAPNRYGAGTFEFRAGTLSAVPVPPSLAMLGTVALGGLIPLYRRMKAKVAA